MRTLLMEVYGISPTETLATSVELEGSAMTKQI
jgi:hypothetical protein